MRKVFGALMCAIFMIAAFGLMSPSTAQAANPSLESQFIDQLNGIRAGLGIGPLAYDGELTGVARSWSDQMLAAGDISHNPNLAGSVSGGWSKLGENVGFGYSVAGLVTAFVNSPAHYRNIIDPAFTRIGVGVSMAPDGRIYTTHDFEGRKGDGGAAPAPAPAPEPAAAPAPAPTPKHKAAPAPAPAPAPEPEAAPAPPPPPPPPPAPPATPARIRTVLTSLRALAA